MQENSNGYIQHKIEAELSLIKSNWQDDIASQYVQYVESILEKIKNASIEREQLYSGLQDIIDRCRDAESSTDDTPKVRTIGRMR